MLDNLKFRTKIILLIAATFLGLATVMVLDAIQLKAELTETRKLQVRSIVESAVQVSAAFHARSGELGTPEAQSRAI